jgi:hypothetical protein
VSAPAEDGGAPDGALRAEHDALAGRLAIRRSVDDLRKAAYAGFAGAIALGLAVKLAFDRWLSVRPTRFQGPPVFFFVALAIAAALLGLTAWWAARGRRHRREEDALFARLLALRARLGLDR